jgi:hypothetical protein
VVRYEDLWKNPIGELKKITDRIDPLPATTIERAVGLCDINVMRNRAKGKDRSFYRKGGSGGWRDELPEAIARILAEEEPYLSQFAALGYDMGALEKADAPGADDSPRRSFVERAQFDNGVRVSPIIVERFMSLPAKLTRRWADPADTSSDDSFFHWLNATDDKNGNAKPAISNLAAYVYGIRQDLRTLFPDVEGADREKYIQWFLAHAPREYALDEAFVQPMRQEAHATTHGTQTVR